MRGTQTRSSVHEGGRPETVFFEEATPTVSEPADPTDPGDAADLSTPQGFPLLAFAAPTRPLHHPFVAPQAIGTEDEINH